MEEGEIRKKGKLIIRIINITRERDFAVDHVEAVVCGVVRTFRSPEQLLEKKRGRKRERERWKMRPTIFTLLTVHHINT